MGLLGGFLIRSRPEAALPVLEANLNLRRRYWSLSHGSMVAAQGNLAACLTALKRGDEALALRREIYAKLVATRGISHEETILCGLNLSGSLIGQELSGTKRNSWCASCCPQLDNLWEPTTIVRSCLTGI